MLGRIPVFRGRHTQKEKLTALFSTKRLYFFQIMANGKDEGLRLPCFHTVGALTRPAAFPDLKTPPGDFVRQNHSRLWRKEQVFPTVVIGKHRNIIFSGLRNGHPQLFHQICVGKKFIGLQDNQIRPLFLKCALHEVICLADLLTCLTADIRCDFLFFPQTIR